MNKLLLSLMAIVMFGITGNAQEKPKVEVTIKIDIDWGRESKGCKGFGICDIDVDVEIKFPKILAFGRSGQNSDGLSLNFTKEYYMEHETLFSSGFIILEEDYTINRDTSLKLGFSDSKTLKKGKYEIVFDEKTNTYNCTIN